MALTAKVLTMDAIATVLTGVIVGVYAGFLRGTSLWLISNARGTTATVLVLGIGAWVLHLLARTQSGSAEDLGWVAIMLSQVALIAAVIGLITGSTVALAVLVVGAAALWLIATARHAIGITKQMYSGHRPPQKMPRVPVPGGAVAPKTGVKGTGAFPFHGDTARVRADPVGRLPGHRGGRRRRDGLPALLGAAALADLEGQGPPVVTIRPLALVSRPPCCSATHSIRAHHPRQHLDARLPGGDPDVHVAAAGAGLGHHRAVPAGQLPLAGLACHGGQPGRAVRRDPGGHQAAAQRCRGRRREPPQPDQLTAEVVQAVHTLVPVSTWNRISSCWIPGSPPSTRTGCRAGQHRGAGGRVQEHELLLHPQRDPARRAHRPRRAAGHRRGPSRTARSGHHHDHLPLRERA